ncbi:MAG: glycosyltransferase family 1 protein, partial [Candidatus Solibacter sp.]
HWIQHLRAAAGGDRIDTFPDLRGVGELTHESSVTTPLRTFAGLATLAVSNYTPAPVLDFLTRGADIFHSTVLVRHPPSRPRLTATVHDLTGFLMPELHPRANLVAEANFAHLARRADGLIAVSECTRQDAIRALGISPDKITTIHSGIAPGFFSPAADRVDAVRARYHLGRPFVLFIGTIEPRKNVNLLLDVWESLPVTARDHYDLVVAGPIGWASGATIERLRDIRYLGYIPEPDLAPLTAAAEVFVYPSLYEGFGFPVVQAMAAGAPVITSNVSSLPEVAGDAALLVDPRSQSELRAAILRLLSSPDLRNALSAAGRARANQFRWEQCAAKSLKFFHRIAGT